MTDLIFDYKVIGSGEKTIVIETGIGNSYYEWYPLIDQIKDEFTIVLYHRLGYGNSQLPITVRTTNNIAEELKQLLDLLEINSFILVAHSFGGLCAQHFAMLYPEMIEGVMLIDSASYNLAELEELDTPFLNDYCSIEKMVEMSLDFSRKSKDELVEMSKNSIEKFENILSKEDMNGYINFISSSDKNKTVSDEFANWITDGNDIKKLNCFPNVPLKVICRDYQVSVDNWSKSGIPIEEAQIHDLHWRKLQEELCDLSIESELIVAVGSDHMIHNEKPDIIIEVLNSFK